LALSRIFAALGIVNIGYIIPDYTAYEDLFNYHMFRVNPICFPTYEKTLFKLTPENFEKAIITQKLGAFLLSNPCNPTGQVVADEDLKSYVEISRKHHCTLILDEFYSHFIYNGEEEGDGSISSASYVESINKDPILIVDGLTKSFRYPGWRFGWIVGPKEMIGQIDRAASAIDGGPGQPIQRLALKALEPTYADQETKALRNVFQKKGK